MNHYIIGHNLTEDSKYAMTDDAMKNQGEVNILVGKEVVNLKELSAPQIRYLQKYFWC